MRYHDGHVHFLGRFKLPAEVVPRVQGKTLVAHAAYAVLLHHRDVNDAPVHPQLAVRVDVFPQRGLAQNILVAPRRGLPDIQSRETVLLLLVEGGIDGF